ncbi:MAG: DUF116 domain-containing protein [Nitrospirae bacterium]|nr:DUF116 domain-containing protein [Nitrospirota bacterium]
MQEPKKRTFIGLLLATLAILCGAGYVIWWIPQVGMRNIHPALPHIFMALVAGVLSFIAFGVILLIITLLRGREIFLAQRLRWVVVKILFPMMVIVGRLFGMSRDSVQQSFIAVNNQLVRSNIHGVKPDRLLILLPHCIQLNDCNIKITGDVHRCKGCGKCGIKDLVAVADKHAIDLSVATGGTLARRIIKEKRPKAIIAVACERDLTSGIVDSYPLPVIGILNQRPFGPCVNTTVEMADVCEALEFLVGLPDEAASGAAAVTNA